MDEYAEDYRRPAPTRRSVERSKREPNSENQNKRNWTMIAFRLPRDEIETFTERAKRRNITLSSFIRRALRNYEDP
jgi:hypothetical protein